MDFGSGSFVASRFAGLGKGTWFKPIQFQVHHIVLESDSGNDELDNVIASCRTCHTNVPTPRLRSLAASGIQVCHGWNTD